MRTISSLVLLASSAAALTQKGAVRPATDLKSAVNFPIDVKEDFSGPNFNEAAPINSNTAPPLALFEKKTDEATMEEMEPAVRAQVGKMRWKTAPFWSHFDLYHLTFVGSQEYVEG